MLHNEIIEIAKKNIDDWQTIMEQLSQRGVAADARSSKALYYACKNNNTKMVEFLIRRGARPCQRNCLKYAARFKNQEMVRLLLANRAKIKETLCDPFVWDLVMKDAYRLINYCKESDCIHAADILQNGFIPKNMMHLVATHVSSTKDDRLISVLLHEISGNNIWSMLKQWNGSSRLFDDCPICLQPKLNAVVESCGHMYHKKCIRKWHALNPNCPICKQPMSKMISVRDYFNFVPNNESQNCKQVA